MPSVANESQPVDSHSEPIMPDGQEGEGEEDYEMVLYSQERDGDQNMLQRPTFTATATPKLMRQAERIVDEEHKGTGRMFGPRLLRRFSSSRSSSMTSDGILSTFSGPSRSTSSSASSFFSSRVSSPPQNSRPSRIPDSEGGFIIPWTDGKLRYFNVELTKETNIMFEEVAEAISRGVLASGLPCKNKLDVRVKRVGINLNSADIAIVVPCKSDIFENVVKILSSDSVQRGCKMRIYCWTVIEEPPVFDSAADETPEQIPNPGVSLCGRSIQINGRIATISSCVIIDDVPYCITTDHIQKEQTEDIFDDFDSTEDVLESDFILDTDIKDAPIAPLQVFDPEIDEDSASVTVPKEDMWEEEFLPHIEYISPIDYHSSFESRELENNTDEDCINQVLKPLDASGWSWTTLDTDPSERYMDAALIRSPFLAAVPNSFCLDKSKDPIGLEIVADDDPLRSGEVYVISGLFGPRNGTLLQAYSFIGSSVGRPLTKVRSVVLSDGKGISMGESGSPVIDPHSQEILGYIIASEQDGEAFMMPLGPVLDKIKKAFPGADVAMPNGMASSIKCSEETGKSWPGLEAVLVDEGGGEELSDHHRKSVSQPSLPGFGTSSKSSVPQKLFMSRMLKIGYACIELVRSLLASKGSINHWHAEEIHEYFWKLLSWSEGLEMWSNAMPARLNSEEVLTTILLDAQIKEMLRLLEYLEFYERGDCVRCCFLEIPKRDRQMVRMELLSRLRNQGQDLQIRMELSAQRCLGQLGPWYTRCKPLGSSVSMTDLHSMTFEWIDIRWRARECDALLRWNRRLGLFKPLIPRKANLCQLMVSHNDTYSALLLPKMIPVSGKDSQSGQTALLLAASIGHSDMVEQLLRHRADIAHVHFMYRTVRDFLCDSAHDYGVKSLAHRNDDLICGTSTGGLIALMLNRLRVQTCLRMTSDFLRYPENLMIHGLTRDAPRSGSEEICLEMEAAALTSNWPCIVIRGVSDYADSYKNKNWQGFAAAAAAAYAQELLDIITPQHVVTTNGTTTAFKDAVTLINAPHWLISHWLISHLLISQSDRIEEANGIWKLAPSERLSIYTQCLRSALTRMSWSDMKQAAKTRKNSTMLHLPVDHMGDTPEGSESTSGRRARLHIHVGQL